MLEWEQHKVAANGKEEPEKEPETVVEVEQVDVKFTALAVEERKETKEERAARKVTRKLILS